MTILRDAEVDGVRRELRVGPGEEVVDARGGAVLPGLHDHHLHLRAMAAARTSVDVRRGLARLRQPGEGWLRGVGGHALTRADLDAVAPHRPVRVQHRSGHAWILNSAGLRELGLESADGLVLGDLPPLPHPLDLTGVGLELASYGITAVTDATPGADAAELGALVPQHVSTLRKVLAPAHEIPDAVRALRPGPVAVHCVTRAEVVTAVGVLGEPGDRIEHAGIVPPELLHRLPAVVTQPGFVADRGDDYLREVDAADQPDLYRFASLLAAGVPTVASSDAPYGPVDPWQVIRAARDRLTATGVVLGPGERVPARVALSGYLRPSPTAAERRDIGSDVVLLHVPLAEALAEPTSEHVRTTWIGGSVVSGDDR